MDTVIKQIKIQCARELLDELDQTIADRGPYFAVGALQHTLRSVLEVVEAYQLESLSNA